MRVAELISDVLDTGWQVLVNSGESLKSHISIRRWKPNPPDEEALGCENTEEYRMLINNPPGKNDSIYETDRLSTTCPATEVEAKPVQAEPTVSPSPEAEPHSEGRPTPEAALPKIEAGPAEDKLHQASSPKLDEPEENQEVYIR